MIGRVGPVMFFGSSSKQKRIAMIKNASLLAVFLASGLMTLRNLQVDEEDPKLDPRWLDPEYVAWCERQSDAELEGHKQFAAKLDDALAALEGDEICLCQACAFIYDASIIHHPAFLRHLRVIEGREDKEKIGAIIVNHFQIEAQDNPAKAGVARKVKQAFNSEAFQSWCRQRWEDCSVPECPHVSYQARRNGM
jgi:hypothetical protein